MGYSHLFIPGLDQHFYGVAEGGNDVQADGRLPGNSPETAHSIGDLHSAQLADNAAAEPLQDFFQRREMGNLQSLPITYNYLGLMVKDRLYQLGNVLAGILVVAVRIDDDVGAKAQTFVQADPESPCQALVGGITENMINPQFFSDLNSSVVAAVIDDQDFHRIYPGYIPGNICNSLRQCLFFVVTGNLNNQLHLILAPIFCVNFHGYLL